MTTFNNKIQTHSPIFILNRGNLLECVHTAEGLFSCSQGDTNNTLLLKDGTYCITFTLFPSAAMNIKDYKVEYAASCCHRGSIWPRTHFDDIGNFGFGLQTQCLISAGGAGDPQPLLVLVFPA